MRIFIELQNGDGETFKKGWQNINNEIVDTWHDIASFIDDYCYLDDYDNYLITDSEGFGDIKLDENCTSVELDEIVNEIQGK